jgi:hypothetical protein
MHFRSPTTSYLSFLLFAVAVSLAVSSSASQGQAKMAAAPTAMSPDLDAARAALAKYSDPFVAIRDGYFSTLACIDFPAGMTDGSVEYPPGAMGVHLLNPANIGPKLDPAKPQVLIYEPVGDKLVLAGAEWFVPIQAAGGVGPMDGHEPIMPTSLRHYDLHVWLWKDNPRGMFTSTNAALKCTPGAAYTIAIGGAHHH